MGSQPWTFVRGRAVPGSPRIMWVPSLNSASVCLGEAGSCSQGAAWSIQLPLVPNCDTDSGRTCRLSLPPGDQGMDFSRSQQIS